MKNQLNLKHLFKMETTEQNIGLIIAGIVIIVMLFKVINNNR